MANPEPGAQCLVHGWHSSSWSNERSEIFKSPALRHHLRSLQSSHRARAGPEAKALEYPHCKQNHQCSQVPTELRSHRMLFLPLALEIGATIYLPKVSSHSTSSSIVRSKSSNEGLPSGFYKKSRRSCEPQNPFPRKLSLLKSHGTPHRQDSGIGETQAGPSMPQLSPWLLHPCCHCTCSGTY